MCANLYQVKLATANKIPFSATSGGNVPNSPTSPYKRLDQSRMKLFNSPQSVQSLD